MKKALSAWIIMFFILGTFAPAAMAASLVTFDGGIGVIPVSSAAGTQNADKTFPDVNRNDVRGVPPGGQPWVIGSLKARVDDNGNIKVKGTGLLLAGGDGIGTTGGQSVHATLFCGPAASASAHSTGNVPLEPNGDFRIDDMLTPLPPSLCDSPVLLIINAGGRWFAAGIPVR
ncbi:MAG TPA: hypothetical protein VLM91_01210 [Candidatus Methylomirabilis sp.]|nr:hypothetical protein [Candidatus Methylomirabilis sp.]